MEYKKVVFWTVVICFVLSLGAFSTTRADTILFPVIAVNQPNVTTIVSVTIRANLPLTHLHYIYRYKDSLVGGVPNISGTCTSASFTRQTFDKDLVSFDASGTMNSGNALFGDTNTYGGGFAMPGTGPRRGYLLVSNSDASGNRVDVGFDDLGGEAIIMDIMYGAAWGYRAVNNLGSENYNFINADDGGGVYGALPSLGYNNRRFTFFPPNEWTNKFFVTPIGSAMNTANLTAIVNLMGDVYDRNGTLFTFTPIYQSVTCTASVDLGAMVDSTVWSAIQNIGGWSMLGVSLGDAMVYKLEYVVNNSTYGGTNNNGYLLYERP